MTGIMKAAQAGVVQWTAGDLGLDAATIGLRGSPTQMLNVFKPPVGRKGEILQGPPNDTAGRLIGRLRAERILR
jgi:electron transfer flavoprotein beta subunit